MVSRRVGAARGEGTLLTTCRANAGRDGATALSNRKDCYAHRTPDEDEEDGAAHNGGY